MYPGRRGREGACGAGRHSLNPNSRLGTSPHRGGWVMDVETTADRFVGIDVSKARVDVHVRPDGTAFGCATDPVTTPGPSRAPRERRSVDARTLRRRQVDFRL